MMRKRKKYSDRQFSMMLSGKRFVLLMTALLLVFSLCFFAPFFTVTARAEEPTDEIEHFVITVDVQEDASLQMTYHIDWRVLDDEEYGPLDWVNIGMPNSNHSEITALGDSIDHIEDKGNTLAVYLDRKYYEDEVASFEFSFVQDHMYQIDRFVEGETVFAFTPAWFDGIEVKDLTIRWNEDKAGAWQPECEIEDGYLVFSADLQPGEKYSMTVVYPNDAFGFSPDRQSADSQSSDWDEDNDDYGYTDTYYDDDDDTLAFIIGLIAMFFFLVTPIVAIVRFVNWIANGIGFGTDTGRPEYRKQITRTKIEYYEFCPGCGAGREEGRDDCAYCGRSMIKSKEIVEEKDLEKPEAYTRNGTYRYGSRPNTYIHVNVINVPVPRTSGGRSGGHRSSGGSRRSHSSCASSCASSFACASSCACACACASSGRAGCSVKEFFKDSIHRGRVHVESRE